MVDCKHPPQRLYAWTAYDGVLCVTCCECGSVLAGAADEPLPLMDANGDNPLEASIARARADV